MIDYIYTYNLIEKVANIATILDKTNQSLSIIANNKSMLYIAICSILLSFIALIFTYISVKNQNKNFKKEFELSKKQWLYASYIKREAEVLLEFRDTYNEVQRSINWYLHVFFNPLRYGNFTPTEEQRSIKPELLEYHFLQLAKLNTLYNKNQLIFRKYNIETAMSYINRIMDTCLPLGEKDLKSQFIKKDSSGEEYHLLGYGKIISIFTIGMASLLENPDLSKKEGIEKMTEINKNIPSKFEEYKNIVEKELISILFKLDELTVFFDGNIPLNLKRREMRNYPSELIKLLKQRDIINEK